MGKKFIAALVIIYIIAVLWTTQQAEASGPAYINKTTYVYAKPSTSSVRVRVAKGTKVTVLAVRSSWARVKRSHYIYLREIHHPQVFGVAFDRKYGSQQEYKDADNIIVE